MFNRPGPIDALEVYEQLYGQGVRVFHVDATCSEDIYQPALRAWVSPDRFDYSPQEAGWEALVRRCPDARFCFRLYVASPPWWDEAYPEELQRYPGDRAEHAFLWTARRSIPSLASERWMEDAEVALCRFLAWLESSGWCRCVWGLHLSYGITWEWGILGSDDFPDYSEPMRRRFRAWLEETYRSADALQKAWSRPGLTFEDAGIPRPVERLLADGDFRVFPRDRPAYDFQRCLSDANADYLHRLARVARKHAGGRYVLGAFYGYTLTAREHSVFMGQHGSGGLHGGHHALGRVLRSGLLDYLASPYAYGDRNLGRGLLIQHYPLGSLRAHGLQGYEENDLRSFTNPPPAGPSPISLGHTASRQDSILHQQWALGQALARGTSFWWTDLLDAAARARGVSNFSDPGFRAEMGRLQRLFSEFARPSLTLSAAQIALVLDEEAIDALGLESRLFLDEVYHQLPQWAWAAVPFDVWLASDVQEVNMRAYRLIYVFAPYLTEARRTALRGALCNAGRTVWWGPASGWLGDGGRDPPGFSRLTGFESPEHPRVPAQPVRREMPDWTSLYGPCRGLTALDLSSLAARAGVHLYGPPPLQVMASSRCVAVHVGDPGAYTLRLPHPGPWEEVMTGRPFQGGPWCFRQHDVAIFVREA